MKYQHTRFFVSLFCIVALTIALTFVLNHIVPQIITPYWSLIISFFAIVNIIIYFISIKVKSKNDVNKMTYFHMIETVVKLLVYLVIIAIYAIKFSDDAKSFVISFLLYYLCFTFFETFVKIKINN
jgi:hypothetical protein